MENRGRLVKSRKSNLPNNLVLPRGWSLRYGILYRERHTAYLTENCGMTKSHTNTIPKLDMVNFWYCYIPYFYGISNYRTVYRNTVMHKKSVLHTKYLKVGFPDIFSF